MRPQRSHTIRSLIITLLPAAVLLAACNDPARPTLGPASGQSLSVGLGTFSDFDHLPSSAACVAPPATLPGFATNQPFVLPAGYTQTILLDEIGDFAPVAGASGNLPSHARRR